MATDPVRQIEAHEYESELSLDLPAALRRLAALPPSVEAPYLTLQLDWRPDGNRPNVRSGKVEFDQGVDGFLAGFAPHTPAHESLSADLERIRTYLDGEASAAAQGIVVVACSADDVFEPLPLAFPLPNRTVTGPTPALSVLARVAEDLAPYAVLLADQREATLSLITQATPERRVDVSGTGYPRKQAQGGWSQRRYQARADERVEAFARSVAEETRRFLDEQRVGALVLLGDEVITPALMDSFHQTVTDRLIGTMEFDVRTTEHQVVEATLPLVERAEREREAAAVQAVKDGVGAGGKGVAGPEDTLTALQTGQVMTLVMTDDFAAPGWADFTLPLYGAGDPPAEHPAGGDPANIVPIALEEELVRLAIQTDAEIEIVGTAVPVSAEEQADVRDADAAPPRAEAALALDALGGVGAVLRFALDAGQPTADLT